MRRSALLALLPLVLLLISAPGASAKTCTANASGAWAAPATWSCAPSPNAVPAVADAVVIPAGRTVTLAGNEAVASVTLAGGTLALGDAIELDTPAFAVAGGGEISGPDDATVLVALAAGAQAAIDSSGLTVTGTNVVITGAGTLGIAGPLVLGNGATFESDVTTTWSGGAPWLLGGDDGTPATSIFEMSSAQLTISGATAAQSPGGDGQIRLDGTSTLVKADPTTSTFDIDVALDSLSEVHVNAGKVVGGFEGTGSLSIAVGATLGLDGSVLQLAPNTMALTGGDLEIEPDAAISLVLPGQPSLLNLGIGSDASLDVSTDDGTGAGAPAPSLLARDIAIGSAGTLSIGSGRGTLGLNDQDALSGSGTVDASLDNSAGTVSPSGEMHLTGDYAQGAGGTLSLALRSPADGDSLRVDGNVGLAGTLRVATSYSPPAAAAPVVLAAQAKPDGAFTTTHAPLASGRAWKPAYSSAGVALGVAGAGQGVLRSLTAPVLRPALPVVGASTRCLPGTWSGARTFAYRWLRGGKPIAGAAKAQYVAAVADSGRRLSCRVTATAVGGAHATAASRPARVRLGLQIGRPAVGANGTLSLALRCAPSEQRCRGSLHVAVAGQALAAGRFSLRSGGVAHLTGLRAARAGETVLVRASYRNRAGQARVLLRRFSLAG